MALIISLIAIMMYVVSGFDSLYVQVQVSLVMYYTIRIIRNMQHQFRLHLVLRWPYAHISETSSLASGRIQLITDYKAGMYV